MKFYQLQVIAYFEDSDPLKNILEELERNKKAMVVVNPGLVNQQCSVISVLECFHQAQPVQPCNQLSNWDNCPDNPPF